jgi:hypothetical protein
METANSPSQSLMSVTWKSVQSRFRYTIEWWDDRGTPNYKRAMAYGDAMWGSLATRKLITSRRPTDIDTKLWLMTLVRLWRDANLDPGLTHSVDDWWGICDWLGFQPERMVEFEDDDSLGQIKEEMEMRMSEAYAALGRPGLDEIVQPYDEDLGANQGNSTAWENLIYIAGSPKKTLNTRELSAVPCDTENRR